MDFDLSEEHQLIERTVREWGAREVAPRIRELDRAHRFDPQILPQMAELGLLGCSVPQEYGGAGMDYISLGLVSEELEYVDTSLARHHVRSCGAQLSVAPHLGDRGSEAAVSRPAGTRAESSRPMA